MIRDSELLEALDRRLTPRSPPDYHENLRIFEQLLAYAQALGALPLADPLEGIETDIRLARILNGLPID